MARAKGSGAAGRSNVPLGTETYAFADDGLVPNSRLPLIVRRGAVPPDAKDPAAAFERVFVKNGWTGTWRDSIYDYPHYHSTAHEVLGVAEGSATVRFGGESSETVGLATGGGSGGRQPRSRQLRGRPRRGRGLRLRARVGHRPRGPEGDRRGAGAHRRRAPAAR